MIEFKPLDAAFDPPSVVAKHVCAVLIALNDMAEYAKTGGNDTSELDAMASLLASVHGWLEDYGVELWRRHMGVGELHA